jgi:hypothetical protein
VNEEEMDQVEKLLADAEGYLGERDTALSMRDLLPRGEAGERQELLRQAQERHRAAWDALARVELLRAGG